MRQAQGRGDVGRRLRRHLQAALSAACLLPALGGLDVAAAQELNLTSADGRYAYTIHNADMLTWDEAAIACIEEGGQLAYVESQAEWDLLAGAMKNLWWANNPTAPASSCPFCSCDTPSSQRCWWAFVGMWGNSTNRSSWRWLDPSPSNVTFQPPWEAGQPNYCGQPAKEKSCAGLWALGNLTQPLLLGDLPCNCSMPYICKTEMGANVSGCPFPDGTVIRCDISSDGSIYKIQDGRKRGYPGPPAVAFDHAVVTINSPEVCTLRDQCPDGEPMPMPPVEEPFEVDVPYLLKQRDAITNWADFKAGNNISGWDESTEVCRWSYIHCRQDHAYAVTVSCAYSKTGCTPRAIGTLAPDLSHAKFVFMVDIFNQNMSGTLPDAWGQNGTFAKLETVHLENSDFTGTLPPGWGTPGAFPRLTWLNVADSKRLSGTVPAAWAGAGSLPSIKRIDLYGTGVCGSVPPPLVEPVCELRSDWVTIGVCETCGNGGRTCPNGLVNGPCPPSCEPGWTNDGAGGCRQCGVPGCQAFKEGCTCSACTPGWQLSPAGSCTACSVAQCQAYSAGCTCITCSTGWQPAGNGSCIPAAAISSNGSSVAAIAGGVAAGVAVAVAAAAAILVYRRRRRRRLAGDDKRGAFALPSTGVPLDGSGDSTGGGGLAAAEQQGASERAVAAALGTLPSVEERIEDELSAPLATFPTRPSSVSPAGAATLLGLAPPRPAAPTTPPSIAGLSQPQTPSLSSAGESLGSSGGRLSRPQATGPAAPAADLSGDAFLSFFSRARAGAASSQPSGSIQRSSTAGLMPHSSASAALLQPWEVTFDSITILSAIGCGSFGKVFLGRWHEIQVAVKLLLAGSAEHVSSAAEARQLLEMSSPLVQRVDAEAGLLASFRHPHVVAFYGICRAPPCIITEYCSRGSLAQLLADAQQDASLAAELSWRRRLIVALQTALGMLYLHSRAPPLVHRDLKSPNLLLDEGFSVKVTDFGLSKLLEDPTHSSSLAAQNPRWLAPEVMRGEHATLASDVFAFGVILWELLTWRLPWGATNLWQIASTVVGGGRLAVPPPEQLPGPGSGTLPGLEEYLALMRDCWEGDPGRRPSFAEIVPRLRALEEAA